MKKNHQIKKALLQAAFFTAILLIGSCSNDQKPEDTKDVAEEQNDARFDNDNKEEAAHFLVNAAEINLEEIQLGQLAQQKGKTTEIKQLGKMMEDAHTKSQRDLSALANSKRIAIPTSPTDDAKETYKELNEESGDDFDKAYADLMVNKHQDAISAFEEASTDLQDTDIKSWATATLPGLRKHLDQSVEYQKKFANMYLEKNN